LTSSGATPTPNLPLALPSPGCSIVSRQQPLVSGYNDIVGLAPQPGDVVFRFVSGNQSYRVWSFDEFDLVWINSQGLPEEPMANVGESIWAEAPPRRLTFRPTTCPSSACSSRPTARSFQLGLPFC
jgi:hypothetical protein